MSLDPDHAKQPPRRETEPDMFRKQHLDKLYEDLNSAWRGKAEFDKLLRDAHLDIAYSDAGRPLDDIDARVVALIKRYRPSASD